MAIKLLYRGSITASSGYAEAARNNIMALSTQKGIDLAVSDIKLENWHTEQDEYADTLNALQKKKIVPEVQIIHQVPLLYRNLRLPGIKNIGYAVWETSIFPPKWVEECNLMDEIWTCCDWNVEVFKSSGVNVPIRKIEHTISLAQFDPNREKYQLGVSENEYVFYSIFQWTARKNPIALLKAFISEFSSNDKVVLVLKTYLRQNGNESDKREVLRLVNEVITKMRVPNPPKIQILHKSLSRSEILGLHARGDCFVLSHSSEGWGVPMFESMAMGNPTIATNFGGNLEFMNSENSYLINYTETPVYDMPWNFYDGRQMWADADIGHLKKLMRYVYENRDEAKKIGLRGRESVKRFSWESVGKKMAKALGAPSSIFAI